MRAPKDRHQQFDVATRGRFVQRNPDRARSEHAQIAARLFRMLDQRPARFDFHPNGVEKVFMRNFQSERAQTVSQLTR